MGTRPPGPWWESGREYGLAASSHSTRPGGCRAQPGLCQGLLPKALGGVRVGTGPGAPGLTSPPPQSRSELARTPEGGPGGEGWPQPVRTHLSGRAVCHSSWGLPAERGGGCGAPVPSTQGRSVPPHPRGLLPMLAPTSTAPSGLWGCPEGCRGASGAPQAGRPPGPEGAPCSEAGGQEAQESLRDPWGGGLGPEGRGGRLGDRRGGRRALGKESR